MQLSKLPLLPPPPPPSPPPPPPPPPPPHWHGFHLSLFWPPGYCRVIMSAHVNCIYAKIREDFTIHGLWPQVTQGQNLPTAPLYNPNLMYPNLLSRLNRFWLDYYGNYNNRFWRYEWNTHGMLSNNLLPQVDYFEKTVQLYIAYNITTILARGKIFPDNSAPTTVTSILGAFSQIQVKRGFTNIRRPAVICRTASNGRTYITEIRFCYDVSATNLVDCSVGSSNSCTDQNSANMLYIYLKRK
ncbi:PREDICTED: ribonuclease MC-like [Ipomoea nil]|uniref:ribonuclease MC-like n=1 Tax=Ipomoea nil TaxID=35883 RepID=UPI0009014902|nr:PREDICTED: ribonuclease MC-like [Ipomoea nil]